jgi:hypothetical protein
LHIIKLKTIVNRKTYTFDEAFKASLDYFTGDELAAKVWVNKYALKDAFGNIYEESPVDMHALFPFGNEIILIGNNIRNLDGVSLPQELKEFTLINDPVFSAKGLVLPKSLTHLDVDVNDGWINTVKFHAGIERIEFHVDNAWFSTYLKLPDSLEHVMVHGKHSDTRVFGCRSAAAACGCAFCISGPGDAQERINVVYNNQDAISVLTRKRVLPRDLLRTLCGVLQVRHRVSGN